MTERIRVAPYRRSAFQVALLMFVTFGLYVFVWGYFIRRACADLLEQEDQPVWKSVALIVPIFNFFLMFDLGKKIQGVQWRADPRRVDGSLPWVGVSVFAFNVLGRLKGVVSNLGLLSFVPIALMQQKFSRAQIALLGEAASPTRFHWAEWIVLVLGGAFWLLSSFGYVVSISDWTIAPREIAWFLGCSALAVAVLARFGFTSRRAIADGLAMYAEPSPDRIAPYAGESPPP
ncbi:MAG: DUF4234 domain-containing protein [Candidatus Eremiobacteraeota bacterium]|nr:DUF4234 domain-containing protein [Candidatus Eremiobacteraeota bacterium]